MATLAGALTILVGRPVLDKTALEGKYDFNWNMIRARFSVEKGRKRTRWLGAKGSIFTTLQEQLDLRLESQRGPLEILVIDGLEKPSEN